METVNAVVDLSHHNGTVNLNQAQKAGILGVIHKATQGRAGVDPTYKANRAKAGKEKLLWGAYHFGTGSDGWFWLAQYGPTAVVPRNWQTWTFWQYTDGAAGPDPPHRAGHRPLRPGPVPGDSRRARRVLEPLEFL